MGAMHRPVPSGEPSLKASDLECEADFDAYCEAHQYVDRDGLRAYLRRDAFESGFLRRRAWLAWRKGVRPVDVNEALRRRVGELLRERPDAPAAAAWAYATKLEVAALACVSPPQVGRRGGSARRLAALPRPPSSAPPLGARCWAGGARALPGGRSGPCRRWASRTNSWAGRAT